MTFARGKSQFKTYWTTYLASFFILLGLKYFYSRAGSDELQWILAPTAWWAGILSGISFKYVPDVGYISHSFRFVIASSCSGVQFMIIASAALIYSFAHRMGTRRNGYLWMALSLCGSYVYTVFVNGLRIVLSIYLPLMLQGKGIGAIWMTPERLHTTIGITVYFSSLFVIYRLADKVSQRTADLHLHRKNSGRACPECPCKSALAELGKWLPPVFWYFFVVLGIPLLNRSYKKDRGNFTEYALFMIAVCLIILFLLCLAGAVRRFSRHEKD